ncbi:MAG: hypothetical protein K8T20_00495 [Planctomycetes bacterium]|nr:hypothetical protein [Planctomycetota bacterium]
MATPDRLARIVVFAVHPQYGGWTLWLKADGAAAAFKVARGGKTAARHDTTVPAADLARLDGLLAESAFWDLPPPSLQSSPMPDETWVEVSAKAQSGIQASVGKFARQSNARFDPILKSLESVAARAWKTPPVSESAYDPYQVPKGF